MRDDLRERLSDLGEKLDRSRQPEVSSSSDGSDAGCACCCLSLALLMVIGIAVVIGCAVGVIWWLTS